MKFSLFNLTVASSTFIQVMKRPLKKRLNFFNDAVYVRNVLITIILLAAFSSAISGTKGIDPYSFSDSETDAATYQLPDWFKDSFLDLGEDLAEALATNKKGLLVYFGSRNCSYCKVLLELNFKQPEIRSLIEENFDVIGLELLGNEEITTFDGETLPIREFCGQEKVRFTPTLVFYTPEGTQALKLEGYRPPDKFKAALNYVIDGHYEQQSLRNYMLRQSESGKEKTQPLQTDRIFVKPPYALDRRTFPGSTPLLVVFEQANCPSCRIFHSEVLQDKKVRKLLSKFEVVQLDMNDTKTPVLTPSGETLTSQTWADKLELSYVPSFLYFDESGKEVLRLDSAVHYHRMVGSAHYVLEKGYTQESIFIRWLRDHSR